MHGSAVLAVIRGEISVEGGSHVEQAAEHHKKSPTAPFACGASARIAGGITKRDAARERCIMLARASDHTFQAGGHTDRALQAHVEHVHKSRAGYRSQQTYRETGGLNYHAHATRLPKLKQEHEWLREADSQVFARFWKKPSKAAARF